MHNALNALVQHCLENIQKDRADFALTFTCVTSGNVAQWVIGYLKTGKWHVHYTYQRAGIFPQNRDALKIEF